jgi:hypothetical protein
LAPRQRLELFSVRVDELSETTLVRQNDLKSEWTISMGVDQSLTSSSIEPNEDLLCSYLLKFRKFISKGEPLYIGAIHNLCQKHFTSEELKGHIRNCRQGWKRTLEHNGVRLTFNGKQISPEYLADLWINGHYFHEDTQKAEELKRYLPGPVVFARHEFIAFVVEATRVIGGTGYAIKMALRDGAVDV